MPNSAELRYAFIKKSLLNRPKFYNRFVSNEIFSAEGKDK